MLRVSLISSRRPGPDSFPIHRICPQSRRKPSLHPFLSDNGCSLSLRPYELVPIGTLLPALTPKTISVRTRFLKVIGSFANRQRLYMVLYFLSRGCGLEET